MLLSRFWYFLLAAAFSAALTAALLAQAIYNRQYDEDLANQLRRDRIELELWMRLDARSRLDAIAPLAAHGDVRDALRDAGRRKEEHVDPKDRRALEKTLRNLNKQLDEMRGDLVFALDDEGVIVAQLGASDPPAGAGLGAFPLVQRALSGYVRDDVWLYNGNLYRMAARPVIDRGRYVGVLVHGMALDKEFAQKIGERVPGASVGFFMQDRMVAAHTAPVENAARTPEMEGPLKAIQDDEELQAGKRTEPQEIGEHARAIYSLVSGSAAHAGVGYVVARPRYVLASPFEIFDRASAQDVKDLPWLVVVGLPLLLFLLAMLWVVLERDRPLRRLWHATEDLSQKAIDRLDIGVFRGKYRRIAQEVNKAMDKAVSTAAEGGGARSGADLDQLLGPEGQQKGGGYFGFATEEEKDAEVPSVPPPPGAGGPQAPPPPKPAEPAAAPAPAPAPAPPASQRDQDATVRTPGGTGAAAPPPPKPPQPSDEAPTAKAPAPPAPPKPPAPPPPQAKPPVPAPKPPAPAPEAQPPAPGPAPDWDDDEGATMVADVPEDLLAKSGDEEEQHFREVYDQYVATKKACGEPTAGLTYEKFAQTLRKNRDQIVQKHGAKNVRFTVYEKNGKAALKATPVKQ